MQVNIGFDPSKDEHGLILGVVSAAYGKAAGLPHLNMTPGEIAEGDALVSAGTVSYGTQFTKSPEAIALEQEIAGKQLAQGSPLATPSLVAPSAGANSTPTIPATAAGGQPVDKTGIPWDSRIHSNPADPANRLTAKGVWAKRKGVTADVVAAVEAELRASMAAGGGVAPALSIPGAQALPAGGVLGGGAAPAMVLPGTGAPQLGGGAPTLGTPAAGPMLADIQATAVVQPQPSAIGAYVQINDFAGFSEWLMPHMMSGLIQQPVLGEALAAMQLIDPATGQPNMQMLATRPDLVPHVHAYIYNKVK